MVYNDYLNYEIFIILYYLYYKIHIITYFLYIYIYSI